MLEYAIQVGKKNLSHTVCKRCKRQADAQSYRLQGCKRQRFRGLPFAKGLQTVNLCKRYKMRRKKLLYFLPFAVQTVKKNGTDVPTVEDKKWSDVQCTHILLYQLQLTTSVKVTYLSIVDILFNVLIVFSTVCVHVSHSVKSVVPISIQNVVKGIVPICSIQQLL